MSEQEETKIKVVFCGIARMGTQSLAAALKKLGYNALHGGDVMGNSLSSNSKHYKLQEALQKGNVEKILHETTLLGYNATLEIHSIFWHEIMQHLSDSKDNVKYIFGMRDFEPFFESMGAMYSSLGPLWRSPLRLIPSVNNMYELSISLLARTLDVDKETAGKCKKDPLGDLSRKHWRQAYDAYVADAIRVTKENPENTKLMPLGSMSYGELCEFLEIPSSNCPTTEPFPHVGKRAEIKRIGLILQGVEIIVVACIMFPAFYILAKVAKQQQKQKREEVNSSPESTTATEKMKQS